MTPPIRRAFDRAFLPATLGEDSPLTRPSVRRGLPMDAMEARLTLPGAPRRAALATAPTPPATAATSGVNPVAILRYIQSGEVVMRLPCNPGSYGSGLSAFTIPGPAPGEPRPYLELRCRVTNGRLETNPDLTAVTFHPPLDNILWVETPRFTINNEGHIIANLSGMWDQSITHDLLGIDAVPLQLSSLYDLIIERSATMAAAAAQYSAGGEPFDVGAYQLTVNRATLSSGSLPIPAEIMSARIAPGTTVSVEANARHVTMTGDYAFSGISLVRPELALRGGAVSAHGTLELSLNPATGVPTSVSLDLQNMNVNTESVTMLAADGSRVALGPTQVRGGSLGLDVNLPAGTLRTPPRISIPRAETRVTAELQVASPDASGTISVSNGAITGAFSMRDGNLDAALSSAVLNATGRNIRAGGGMARIAYSDATIFGSGSVVYGHGRATFDGDLTIDGTVADASVGRVNSPFSLDVASGATVDLRLTHASFGGAEAPELSASGELDVTLDSGQVTLPGGAQMTLARGTRAYVNARQILSNDAGMTVRGAIDIEAELGVSIDPTTIAAPLQITRIAGTEGRFHIAIPDCELLPDGTFRASGLASSAHATITGVSGRISRSALGAIRRGRSHPSTDSPITVAPAELPTPAIAPSLIDAVSAIASARVTVSVPLPAGDVGTIGLPFGASYAPLTIAPNTTATFTMTVADGVINRSGMRLTVTPALDLPAWVTSRGMTVDANGNIMLHLSGAPDVNLSSLLGLHVPSRLLDLMSTATSFGGSSDTPSDFQNGPLGLLASHGVSVQVRGVRFNAPIGLGGASYIVPATGNTFDMDISGGELHLRGRVSLADGAIGEAGTGIRGLRGNAEVQVRVRGDGDAQVIDGRLNIVEAQTTTLAFTRSNGDHLALSDTRLANATIDLHNTHGATTVNATIRSVSGTLAPSQLSVMNAETSVPITIDGGAFDGHDMVVSNSGFSGSAGLTGVHISAPALDLPISGLALHTTRLDATVTGELSFDAGSRASFSGNIAVAADIDRGSFGASSGIFSARIGRGTRARLALTALAFGNFEAGHVLAAGSGDLRLSMRGGHITLPNGTRLTLGAGSTGTLRVDSVSQAQGDALADIRGSFRFTASTSARIPAGGLEVAPGVRLTRVDGASGSFELRGSGFHLGHDGRFSIGSVSLDSTVGAATVEATVPR